VDIKTYCAGGKTLVLGHKDSEGNEFDTVYCHLSNIPVTKGATVYKGDVIALSGSTVGPGCKKVDPHLHFSVYLPSEHNGKYDSHTSPIETLYMREQGSNFRMYNSVSRDLDNKIVDKLFESANKKNGGTSQLQQSDSGKNQITNNQDNSQIPIHLIAPQLISPPNGQIFSNYPRWETFKWAIVPGATTYNLEIQSYYLEWSPWSVRKGISGTEYPTGFVGAQPGRWRVWAVSSSGEEGPKSGWRKFEYTV